MITRRTLFAGLGAMLATPAVAKVASLIPIVEAARVRWVDYVTLRMVWRGTLTEFVNSNPLLDNILSQYDSEFARSDAKIGTQLRIRLPADYRLS